MSFDGSVVFNNTDFDAFASATSGTNNQKTRELSSVHIRNQQWRGRKSLTTVQGLATDLDLPKILKCMRKMFSTNGTILHDKEGNEILQLQGDFRRDVAEFLIKYKVCEKEEVQVHGA